MGKNTTNDYKKVSWFPIANDTLRNNTMKIIGVPGFTILCKLLSDCKYTFDNYYTHTTLRFLENCLLIKDTRTIKRYLLKLEKLNYIKIYINNGKDIVTIKKESSKISFNKSTPLIIEVIYKQKVLDKNIGNGYIVMSNDYFSKNIYKVYEYSWAIFILLCTYYNKEQGYAWPTYKQIMYNLNIGSDKLKKGLNILQENKLIKIWNNNETNIILDEDTGEVKEIKKENNKYNIMLYENKKWKEFIEIINSK